MNDFSNLMKQALQMKEKMAELEESMASVDVTGTAGGGMVELRLNVKGEMLELRIDPKLMRPEDVDVVADLVRAAHNDARQKAGNYSSEKMRELAGSMGLPNIKFPF